MSVNEGTAVAAQKLAPETPASGGLFGFGIWSLLFIAVVLTGSVIITGYYYPTKYISLGAWGDFAGGLLNPLLTFITFLAVLLTIWLQRLELGLTREEMVRSANALESQNTTFQKQSFETTFFEMLRLHNSILDSIDLSNAESGHTTRGRDAFNVFYTRLTKIYRVSESKYIADSNRRNIAEHAYFLFWKDAKTELGHYFRFLFNFFRFIEKSGVDDNFYVKLLRSQLSDQELLLLFYNNVSPHGEAFRHYANLYELFDNLPVERLLDSKHETIADKKAYGQNLMNFRPYQPKLTPKPNPNRNPNGQPKR